MIGETGDWLPPWQPIAGILAVNTLAPYILTALVERPDRLVYISSSEHHAGEGPLRGIDWTSRRWDSARVYGESKLYVTALAFAVARRWPEVLSNAVDPGWARTRMEGRALRSTSRPGSAPRAGLRSAMSPRPWSRDAMGIKCDSSDQPLK